MDLETFEAIESLREDVGHVDRKVDVLRAETRDGLEGLRAETRNGMDELRAETRDLPALLQPAAHAFVMAREDVAQAVGGLSTEDLWLEPGGITPLGFHLAHLSGSTDRLLTYARGEALSPAQRDILVSERTLSETRPPLDVLLERWNETVEAALQQLASTSEAVLSEPRAVGRARLPSTVLGLLFHAAEHASRHTGQIVTTAKIVRARSG